MKGYCSKCKMLKEIKNPIKQKLKNGDVVYIGKCETCDTEIYKKEQ